jgi:chromosome segregation protein
MHDVIFAGTSKRKALNIAEVTITLSDVAGDLPVDYEEIAVTRRLHRSGESEYLINRQPVRLRDIRSLFLDSGMGKNAYSIFEQGKIDEVINRSPQDRRRIFEEAAGILRFLERKHEALRDLNKTDENMTRIRDVHHEVEKQIQVSEQQAAQAVKYKANKAELEKMEKAVLLGKCERLGERLEKAEEKEAVLAHNCVDAEGLLQLLNTQVEEAKEELERREKTYMERSEKLFATRSAQAIQNKEQQSNQARLKETVEKEKKYRKTIVELRQKRETERVDVEHSRVRLSGLEKDLLLQEEALNVATKQAKKLDQDLTAMRAEQERAQKDRVKLLQEEHQVAAQLKESQVRLESHQDRLTDIQQKQRQGRQWEEDLRIDLGAKEKALAEVNKGVDTQRASLVQLEASLKDVEAELEEKRESRALLSEEQAELKARQKALCKLKEDMEGFSQGSKLLLQESTDPKSPLYQKLTVLHEMIRADEGYELALGAAMRPYMQTLVVQSRKDFNTVLQRVQDLEISDFSLLCAEDLCAASKPRSEGEWLPLQGKVALSAVAEHFLHDVYVGQANVVDAPKGVQAVTQEGIMVDRKGVVFYASQGAHNAFVREAELGQLESRLKELEAGLAELAEAVELLQKQKVKFDMERSDLDQAIRRAEMKQVEINFGVQQCRQAVEKHEEEFSRLQEEQTRLAETVAELTEKVAGQTKRHQELQRTAEAEQDKLGTAEAKVRRLAEEYQEAEEARQELFQSHQQLKSQCGDLSQTVKVFAAKEEEGLEHEERLSQEVEALEEQREELMRLTSQVSDDLGMTQKELTEAEKECEVYENAVKHAKRRIVHIETNIRATRDMGRVMGEEKHQQGIKVANLRTQLEAQQASLFERHQLTVDECRALDLPQLATVEDGEKRVRQLRRDIEAAGNVNMTAIEAFEEQKVRHQELSRQIGDMETSKEELMGIIQQLDEQCRLTFRETFTQIRDNFQKNFRILFNGGEADLTFTDSKDVLEAGVEIIAKPPGKKMRSIQLLSGGEKCLTAMALLFAIFEVKSAPFCILDEIDAPLDDSNISRFVNVVQQFTDRSQFVIITHNKRTMAIADSIFGVSMEERGVSKLLNMRFTEAVEHAEDLVSTVC